VLAVLKSVLELTDDENAVVGDMLAAAGVLA
jgi:hypothetical protein